MNKRDSIIQVSNRILAEVGRATVRQLFYQLVVQGIVENRQTEYNYVSKVLTWAREQGLVDWWKIVDATRSPLGNSMDNDLKGYIETLPPYRQNIWKNQEYYIEVWLEKEALSRIVEDALSEWDNRIWLQPMRGYTSYTAKKMAEQRFTDHDKVVILILSDFDPSGKDIARDVMEFFGWNVECKRIALTKEQIEEYNLPNYPAKTSDPRYRKDQEKIQVELDALRPDVLQEIVKNAVREYFDEDAYLEVLREEEEIRRKVENTLNGLVGEDAGDL